MKSEADQSRRQQPRQQQPPTTTTTVTTNAPLPALVQEKVLDSTGKPHHQYEFLDPYFVEGQHVTVHSVAHVPGRYLAVVSD